MADIVRRGADHWLEGSAGERLWLIDEITSVKGAWPPVVKRLRDSHPSFSIDTVVLTGSSAQGFDQARKLLAGRRGEGGTDRVLFQMGFIDVARALGIELPPPHQLTTRDLADRGVLDSIVSDLRPWVPSLIDAWDRYLSVGGYPQAVAAELDGSGQEAHTLSEALWDVIQGDAFGGSAFTHTQTQALLRALTASLSSRLSVHSVAGALDVADETARRRLDALRRAFIAFPVHREQGLAPNPRAQSKWYFTDPALAFIASRLGAGQPPKPSHLSEQQLAVALLRALEKEVNGAAVRHDGLLHYRSTTGAEIDFVSPHFAESCVESRFVDRAWGRAFQTIGASGRRTGIVATRSGLRRHEGGWALPAGLVAFLLHD